MDFSYLFPLETKMDADKYRKGLKMSRFKEIHDIFPVNPDDQAEFVNCMQSLRVSEFATQTFIKEVMENREGTVGSLFHPIVKGKTNRESFLLIDSLLYEFMFIFGVYLD